ncbi:MAG: excinuclease ABC subunit UvrC [Oscillospiraceae bacterium]|nr:excinuclease ABC subunit UvrC [Oscillospiraceae bacterium]
MKDKKNQIIYIGKAKNLHKRVSSYFRIGAEHLPKVEKMISHVWDYDFIVTDSEQEALLLECSLIKQHQPDYNILLKDDKGFYYIKISQEEYPRITVEKQKTSTGKYIKTYTSGFVAKSVVEEVNNIFKLPTCCKKFPQSFKKARPCLNYYIKKCSGICQGHISQEDYQKLILQAINYIQNGSINSIERMQKEMEEASENLDFERAVILRDRIKAIQKASESQKIIDNNFKNTDIIAVANYQDNLCISVLVYREGKLYDKLNFNFQENINIEESVLDAFVLQFYHGRTDLPKMILLESELAEMKFIENMLSEQAGYKIKLLVPKKGNGLQLVHMAKHNAMEYIAIHENRTSKELLAIEALGKLLGMSNIPEYIEAYDISNFGSESESMVAGMVVFENGRPLKKAYRRFKIKNLQNQNDYACMQEVIRRRLKYLDNNNNTGFGRKPDLILLDGGKGHVHAVQEIIQEIAPEIAVFGMVKDNKHRTRAIATNDGEISISSTQNAFYLITRIQDEVHRYAVAYMHKKHKKYSFSSELTKIEGIGEKRAQKLMLYFKTRNALLSASVQDLQKAGISEKTALHVYNYLHELEIEQEDFS